MLVPIGDDDDYDDDIRESAVRTSQSLLKTAQFELCFGEDLLKLC